MSRSNFFKNRLRSTIHGCRHGPTLAKRSSFQAVTNEVVELFDLKGLSVPRFGAGLLHSGGIPALMGYMTMMVSRRWQKGSNAPNSSEIKMKRERVRVREIEIGRK